MKRLHATMAAAVLAAASLIGQSDRSEAFPSRETVTDTIIGLERGALDRWGRGDPQGYMELYAAEIGYFDPFTEVRVDGIDGMKKMLAPFVGKIKVDSFHFIHPRVQVTGDIAVFTFNLQSFARNPDGSPRTVHWNSTEVYRRSAGKWKIIHTHWSFTRPELKPPGGL